jgi:hypothetical protein
VSVTFCIKKYYETVEKARPQQKSVEPLMNEKNAPSSEPFRIKWSTKEASVV